MKRLVLLLPFVLGTLLLLAQQPSLLRNSQYLGYEGHKVKVANEMTLLLWNDTSSGDSDILAQKITSMGNLMWSTARPLVAKPLNQRVVKAINGSDGNVLLLYSDQDIVNSTVSYWVQKLSLAGQAMWPNGGVQLLGGLEYFSDVQLVANSSGGAYAIWRENYPGINVRAVNLDGNGTNLWPADPLYGNPGLSNLQAVTDGNGGFILNCSIYTSGQGMSNHLIRFDPAGDIIGSNPMLPPGAAVPYSFKMLRDSQGNYILFSNQDNSLKLQKMDINGNTLFPSVISHPVPAYVYFTEANLKVCPDGALAYVYQYSVDNDINHISLNYLNSSGQAVWANPLDITAPGCNSLNLEPNNGFWLSWISSNSGAYYWPNDQVFTTLVDLSGNMLFPPLGISNEIGDKLTPVISAFENRAIVCWNEWSGINNNIKTQGVGNDGTILQEPEGRSVHSVLNGSTELVKSLNLGNNFIHLYYDSRLGWANKIYYQITDVNGTPTLENNGRVLNPDHTGDERLLDCIVSSNNSVWVFYSLYNSGEDFLYLQEINPDGSTSIQGLGAAVSNGSFNTQGCKLSQMGQDIMVVWPALESGSGYSSIYGQKYSNGIAQWQSGGKILLHANGNYLIPKAMQSDYLVYLKEDYSNSQILLYALRINSEGNPLGSWPEIGVQVFQGNCYFATYFQSGLVNNDLVVSALLIDGNFTSISTLAQRISPQGSLLWGQDGVVLASDEAWTVDVIVATVYDNGLTCLLWNQDTNVLRLQRVNLDGTLPWGETGCVINTNPSYNQNCALLKFPNGIYSVFHNSIDASPGVNLFRSDVADTGDLLHPDPLVLATNSSGFWFLQAASNQSEAILSWNDNVLYDLREKGEAISLNSLWACRVNAPVSTEDQLLTPLVSELGNHPNPFVGSTSIGFRLKDAAPVKVEIYNLKGQLVRSLLNERKAQGEYELIWDSCDDSGRGVAAGIYLYKIQAGKYSSSKKMVLLK